MQRRAKFLIIEGNRHEIVVTILSWNNHSFFTEYVRLKTKVFAILQHEHVTMDQIGMHLQENNLASNSLIPSS